MTQKKKNILKLVAFLLVLCLSVGLLSHVLSFKYYDGIRIIDTFYKQKENSIDVLVVGSSHAYSHTRTTLLWEEFGYSSFVLGGSIQPLWNSYYYLVEALKTQTPKVIVLEGYRLAEGKEYTTVYYGIKNTYGLKWSLNKLQAMRASFSDEDILEYSFPFNNYHSRYGEINGGDFSFDYGSVYYENYKGDLCSANVYEGLERPDVDAMSKQARPLTGKNEEYYRKILELGQEHGIPVVTYVFPYEMPEYEYGYFLAGEQIAAEYNMPFINGNELYDEIGIDFATDYGDQYSHLNYSGSAKATRYLGNFLAENYDIPDHRGDPAYESWQINADQFDRFQFYDHLPDTTALGDYTRILSEGGDYTVLLSVNGCDMASDTQRQTLQTMFSSFGADGVSVGDGLYQFSDNSLVWSSNDSTVDHAIRLGQYGDVKLETQTMEFLIAGEQQVYALHQSGSDTPAALPAGVSILVYDELFERTVELCYWDFYSEDDTLVRENTYLEQ